MSRHGVMCVALLAVLLLVAGTASASTVTVPLSDFVIFSGGGTSYNQWDDYETEIGGHTDITGNIGSNQDLFQQGNPLSGYPAQLSGSAYAGGYLKFGQDLTVGSSSQAQEVVVNGTNPTALPGRQEAWVLGGATIYGNMFVTGQTTNTTVQLGTDATIRKVAGSGGNIEFTGGTCDGCDDEGTNFPTDRNVEGTVSSPSTKTFQTITMPAATVFSAGGANQTVSSGQGQSLTLAPGTYGALATSSQDQSVFLSSGNYYFDSITTQGGFSLQIDLTSGQLIKIYVVGNAAFAGQQTLLVKGAGTGGAYVPIDQAPHLASLIYLETHETFSMVGGLDETHNIWGGTVYASLLEGASAEIAIGQYTDWYGAAYAFDSFDTADHGYWELVALVPIPGAVWLLGSGLIGLVFVRRRIKS